MVMEVTCTGTTGLSLRSTWTEKATQKGQNCCIDVLLVAAYVKAGQCKGTHESKNIHTGSGFVDGVHHIHALGHLAEHDVLGGSGLVPEVQEAVVLRVDEELGSAGLRLASVSLKLYL